MRLPGFRQSSGGEPHSIFALRTHLGLSKLGRFCTSPAFTAFAFHAISPSLPNVFLPHEFLCGHGTLCRLPPYC